MSFWEAVVLTVVLSIGLVAALFVWLAAVNKKAVRILKEIPDFTPAWVVGEMGLALGLDVERSAIGLASAFAKGRLRARKFTYRDILMVEILENGGSVTRTDRASQIGGAMIGGLAFGGVGAVVGALTGSKTTTPTVKSLEIRVLVNDPESPSFAVPLLNGETSSGGFVHKMAMERAKEWQGRIELLIRKADQEDLANAGSVTRSLSLPQELERLASLKASGALSEEEFAAAKRSLLQAPAS